MLRYSISDYYQLSNKHYYRLNNISILSFATCIIIGNDRKTISRYLNRPNLSNGIRSRFFRVSWTPAHWVSYDWTSSEAPSNNISSFHWHGASFTSKHGWLNCRRVYASQLAPLGQANDCHSKEIGCFAWFFVVLCNVCSFCSRTILFLRITRSWKNSKRTAQEIFLDNKAIERNDTNYGGKSFLLDWTYSNPSFNDEAGTESVFLSSSSHNAAGCLPKLDQGHHTCCRDEILSSEVEQVRSSIIAYEEKRNTRLRLAWTTIFKSAWLGHSRQREFECSVFSTLW